MKWFDKWFVKKCKWAWENRDVADDVYVTQPHIPQITLDSDRAIDSSGMNLRVHRANGGHIIETRKYNRKRDENDISLHIITDDKDLGQEIGKIITFEQLRS